MSYEKYTYLLPEDTDICAIVETGGITGRYGSNFIGLGFTFHDALKDAAKEYKSISLDISDYDLEQTFDKDYVTGERYLYLFFLDPIYLISAIIHNFTLEESVGNTDYETDPDEFVDYSQQIREIVNELNVKNKFKKYHPYYNYFSMYADNPEDTALKEEFDKITEKFANRYPNSRFSIYCGRFTGTTGDEAIQNMLYSYDMGDTALAKLTPENIPKRDCITDKDTLNDKTKFWIPCEVLNAAKHGNSLEELITYWSEFCECEYYDSLLDEADSLLNAGDDE